MKTILTLVLITTISFAGFSQDINEKKIQDRTYKYAYIAIEGKLFSKKLRVQVDFGDTPEQIIDGKEYSETLTDKKSYAAILNYMTESQFELVETLNLIESYQGTGGTSGIVFIMRKKN
jgi:hypothetical protein